MPEIRTELFDVLDTVGLVIFTNCGFTATVWLFDELAPALSVTVAVTVKVPARVY